MSFDILMVGAEAAQRIGERTEKRISKAQRSGIRKAGGVVRKTFRANASFAGGSAPAGKLAIRTGAYRKSIKLKTFQYRDRTWGAALKVRGQRGFVFRLHETGYVTRKGGRKVGARQPGQTALTAHHREIPVLIERFIADALKKV